MRYQTTPSAVEHYKIYCTAKQQYTYVDVTNAFDSLADILIFSRLLRRVHRRPQVVLVNRRIHNNVYIICMYVCISYMVFTYYSFFSIYTL